MRDKIGLISHVILLLSQLSFVLSEFRFCYKGPQRMSELDCPGGFIAKEKLPISCKYFARTVNISTATAKFTGNVCDPASVYDVNSLISDQDDLSKFGTELHQVIFEIDEQVMESDVGGIYTPEDVCFTSCLPEWVDPFAVEDEPFIEDGTESSAANRTGETALELNKQIFLALMDQDEEDDGPKSNAIMTYKRKTDPWTDDIEGWDNLRILKLLAKSMRIVVSECAPYVEEGFFRQVLKAMTFLAKKNESVILDVTIVEYKYFNSVLNRCLQRRNLHFTLNGTVCDGAPKVDGIYYFKQDKYWKYRQTAKSFRWGKHNPFIEAAWNSIEFVHGYCFEAFVYDLMDLHTYQAAMEGLFTSMVMQHWVTVFHLKNEIFWNNVLQTTNLNNTMHNLDACVIGGNSMAPWTKRLERPYVNEAASSSTTPDPNFKEAALPLGWNKAPEKYWQWYEQKGGFKEISKNFGTCINNEDFGNNKNDMEDQVKSFTDVNCPTNGQKAA